MALSGSFNTTAYSGRYLVFSWTATQSIADNTSTISWTLKGAGGSSGYYKAGNFKVIIAGETVYSSSARIELYNGTLVASGSKVIKHNTDGSKSFSASAEAGIYSVAVNCSGSGSFTLTSIPRAATITSATNFNDEANPTISYSNPAGNSVSSLQACITLEGNNADIAYRAVSKTGGSYTFSLTSAERTALRKATTGANSRKIGFYLKTTIGGTDYYSKVWKTFSIINGAPTLSPSVQDAGAISTILTGNPDVIIGGYNACAVSTGAAAVKEATITKQSVSCGGKVLNAASGALRYVNSGVFLFSVTDNRGNTTEKTVEKPFIDYFKPTCSLGIAAPTTAGTMGIAISGKWFNGSFGAVDNALAVQYRIKENNGSYSEWQDTAAIFENNEYKAEFALSGLNYQNTYTVQARAVDEVGQRDSNYIALTNERTVKTTPVYDWGENDFSINVPLYLQGKLLGDFVIDQGTSGIWSYRLWKSGKAECWGYLSHNTAVNTAWGSMYVGTTKMSRQYYPFTFVSKPTEIVNVHTGNSAVWLFAESGGSGSNSTTYTGIYNVCRPTAITSSNNFHFNFYVIGRYK
jgi:hypothetical protein